MVHRKKIGFDSPELLQSMLVTAFETQRHWFDNVS